VLMRIEGSSIPTRALSADAPAPLGSIEESPAILG
jgi:hypothetical protein